MRAEWGLVPLVLCLVGCDATDWRRGQNLRMRGHLEKSCSQSPEAKQGVDCACVARELVHALSEEELAWWRLEPDLFSQEERSLLVSRQAIVCMRAVSKAACHKGASAAPACDCIVDGFYDSFDGEELADLVERNNNGAPLPQKAIAIRTECLNRHAPPRLPAGRRLQ